MRSPAARIAIGLAAVAAVVVLFIVFAGGDDDGDNEPTTTTQTQTHDRHDRTTGARRPRNRRSPPTSRSRCANGKPVGGVKELSYKSGDRIQFVVTSDVADEVHVHGYDIAKDVPAGGSVRFSFPAKLEGVFEVELEGRKRTDRRAEGLPLMRRRWAAALVAAVAVTALAVPATGGRARARRPRRPADPGVAVRLGGRGRPDRVVRGLATLWQTPQARGRRDASARSPRACRSR